MSMKLWFFGSRKRPLMAGPDDGPVVAPAGRTAPAGAGSAGAGSGSGRAQAPSGQAVHGQARGQAMPVRVLRGPGALRHRMRRIEARLVRARAARERDRARGHGREALAWWDHEIAALEAEAALYRLKLSGDWKP